MQNFDINKFPKKPGLILMPISISRISNAQSAEKCFGHIQELVKKIVKPWVGVCFIYGDNLYLYSDEKASVLKNSHQGQIVTHKNTFLSILDKNPWYIQSSINYLTWNQALLESRDFATYFAKLKKIYTEDNSLQDAVKQDFEESERPTLDENQINFFLEESLLFHLVLKGIVRLPNEFLHGHEEWILHCYPGSYLQTEVWLHKNNPFSLSNPKNKYEDCMYNLEDRTLVDLKEVVQSS